MDKKQIKTRVMKSIERYSQRKLPKVAATGKRNAKPEKQVEAEILKWCRDHDFDMSVVDSSTYGVQYGLNKTSESLTDLIGNVGSLSAWIELKAPKKLSTISLRQNVFLRRKIEAGAFAVCVDSAKLLEQHWGMWSTLREDLRKEYLLGNLPDNAEIRAMNKPIFNE